MPRRPTRAAVVLSFVVLTLSSSGAIGAQQPAQQPARDSATRPKPFVVAGERAGPSQFPRVTNAEVKPLVAGQLDWQHYHANDEINAFMRQWADRYPDIVSLYEVGRSFGGQPIWQLTLTNKKT